MKFNSMELKFRAISENEAFARTSVASFCLQTNPSLEELSDIKTAVSEAVTNSIVHAYPDKKGDVYIFCTIVDDEISITVCDDGIGIDDYEKARTPFYTSKPESERSGMGFAVMESFMDTLSLGKYGNSGLCVQMTKKIRSVESMVKGG